MLKNILLFIFLIKTFHPNSMLPRIYSIYIKINLEEVRMNFETFPLFYCAGWKLARNILFKDVTSERQFATLQQVILFKIIWVF